MHAGDYLRQCRMKAKMTQKEAARRAGIKIQSWSNWERGLTYVPDHAWEIVGVALPGPGAKLDYSLRARSPRAEEAAKKLRELRERHGFTQGQCAEAAGVRRDVWGGWETGRAAAPAEAFMVFGPSYAKFASRSEGKRSPPAVKSQKVRPGGSAEVRREYAANQIKIKQILDRFPDMSSAAISRALGISVSSVGHHRRQLGKPPDPENRRRAFEWLHGPFKARPAAPPRSRKKKASPTTNA